MASTMASSVRVFTVKPQEFAEWAKHEAEPAAVLDTAAKPAPGMPAMRVAQAAPSTESFVSFPRQEIPAYAVPQTPIPAGLTFSQSLVGDPVAGATLVQQPTSMCMACHTIKGNPMMQGVLGPNLTHVASRATIAGGLYPNDKEHLELWIKNAREMKPGVLMYTLGAGQIDPATGKPTEMGKLTDQQIADIVAYLQTLK